MAMLINEGDLVPEVCFGLDPVFNSFVNMYIMDLLVLPLYRPGVYRYKTHPILKVDVMGVIVKVTLKEKITIYSVDDGTGVISCSCWKQPFNSTSDTLGELQAKLSGSALGKKLEELRRRQESREAGFSVGDLLHVRGALHTYRDVRQIKAHYFDVVKQPMAEVEHMSQLPDLYKTCYDQPFVLPPRVAKQMNRGGVDGATAVDKIDMEHAILQYSDTNKLSTLTLSDFTHPSGALSHIMQGQSVQVIQDVLSCMESTGHLCRKSSKDKTNTWSFLVVAHNTDLHRVVLDVIRQFCGQYPEETGCHCTFVQSSLRNTLTYSLITKPAVIKCLSVLEARSDIISTTESHYIVFG